MEENEIYRYIEGFNKSYMVSNYGNIKSVDRVDYIGKRRKGKLLKTYFSKYGYKMVCLTNKGIQKNFLVHRLVASAFLDNKDCLPEVNHKDGNKSNNHVSNLEWVTKSQNVIHAFTVLKRTVNRPNCGLFGKLNYHAKAIYKIDNNGNAIKRYDSITEASKELCVSNNSICHVLKGRTKQCKGFKFIYAEPKEKEE